MNIANIDPFEELDLIIKILSCKLQDFDLREQPRALDDILKLLSHRTRRRMLVELAKRDLFVNSIIDELSEHPQAIVRHLKTLKDWQLVQTKPELDTQRGRPRIYYALDEDIRKLLQGTSEEKTSKKGETRAIEEFPRLRFLHQSLQETTSLREINEIEKEAEKLQKIFEEAILVTREIIKKAGKKIKPIPID